MSLITPGATPRPFGPDPFGVERSRLSLASGARQPLEVDRVLEAAGGMLQREVADLAIDATRSGQAERLAEGSTPPVSSEELLQHRRQDLRTHTVGLAGERAKAPPWGWLADRLARRASGASGASVHDKRWRPDAREEGGRQCVPLAEDLAVVAQRRGQLLQPLSHRHLPHRLHLGVDTPLIGRTGRRHHRFVQTRAPSLAPVVLPGRLACVAVRAKGAS